LLGGCHKTAPRPLEQATNQGTLGIQVSDILGSLSDLDAAVSLDIRPMVLLLDAKKTSNHDHVQATLAKEPSLPDAPCILLHIVTKNCDLTQLGVQPGDWVRIFYEGAQEQDGGQTEHKDLEVAKVLNASDLWLKQGPEQPIETPVTMEIWRRTTSKLIDLQNRLQAWAASPEPALDWEPTPDEQMLQQVVERLNQANVGRQPPADWKPDPLLETLPAALRGLPELQHLSATQFTNADIRPLEEAVWLKSISNLAVGEATDDLERAKALFDWTIRHIQLNSRERLHGVWRQPWQAIFFGSGTAADRAQVFLLLARQQGLDGVFLLAPADPAPEKLAADAKLRPFLPAVLIHHELYLFDPALGLPIPGPRGKGVATLRQAAENDAVWRGLDLDAQQTYPWKAADLKQVVACIAASPLALSARVDSLDQAEHGPQRVVFAVDPSGLAKKLADQPQVAAVRLWTWPFETLQQQRRYPPEVRQAAIAELQPFLARPLLWKARLLDFKRTPVMEHQTAQSTAAGEESPAQETERRARGFYMKARSEDDETSWIPSPIFSAVRRDAAYWLGEIALDQGDWTIAIDYFLKRTLEADRGGPWVNGARYNLARAYEGSGDLAAAINWYEGHSATPSPQDYGNALRAKWLKARSAPEQKTEPEHQPKDPPTEPTPDLQKNRADKSPASEKSAPEPSPERAGKSPHDLDKRDAQPEAKPADSVNKADR
ncbi:MAG TPA: transglutaminase domain-containing protein, partial [Pirellulales bacterium]|nr:transglutaminase domain-containing protein [Pirellulales bacterium]